MNKVDFITNRGRVERVHPKIAELLQRKGKGTYRTTSVAAAPLNTALSAGNPEVPPAPAETSIEPGIPDSVVTTPIDLASMSVEELREHAKKQGVQVHHRAGATTILKELEKASATPDASEAE